MELLKVGYRVIDYSILKELYYYVTKEYFLREPKLFESLRIKNGGDKKNATYVEVSKGERDSFFDLTSNRKEEWDSIIDFLNEKYQSHIKPPKEDKIDVDDEDKKVKFHKNLEKNVKSGSILGRLLFFNPINEEGVSDLLTFDELKKHIDFGKSNKDDSCIPNNGTGWNRTVEKYFKFTLVREKGKTVAFKFDGFNFDYSHKNRYIRKDIRKFLEYSRCAHCGVKGKKMEIDHKNGRYNDDNVLSSQTQNLSDFQPLCGNCNKLKRSACKKCKETGLRYDAQFLGYPFSQLEGDAVYTDKLGCSGCYLFDSMVWKFSCTKNI